MKITIHLALFFTLAVLGLSACSKEKKIERSLFKKDGVWDVTSVHHLYYSYDSLISDETYYTHPAFVFYKRGKFEWENGSVTGTWLNTDDDIVITLDQPSLNSSNVYIFQIIEESKGEMTLKRTRSVVDMGSWTSIDTYRIKRRK
ncbi:hypothetical protein D3C87_269860 [compost metagenome]